MNESSPGEGRPPAPDDATDPISALERERDDLLSRYQRTLADFQNYQRRSLQNEREARTSGIIAGIQGFLPVLEHLDIALSQSPANASPEQIVAGLRAIRDEMVKVLRVQGINAIEPKRNDPFEPGRHEAIMQSAAEGVEPGRIALTMQVGYAMGERLIRPARVVVAPAEV